MIRTSIYILAALLLISIYFLLPVKQTVYKKAPLEKRMQQRAEQEVFMTKDPNTGRVPREELFKVKDQLVEDLKNKGRSAGELLWTERGPNNFAGRIRKFALDPDDPTGSTVWAGGVAGGIWRGTNVFDANYEWRLVDSYTGNVGISSIVFDPENSDIMYVGTGEAYVSSIAYTGDGIYKSVDHGETWNKLSSTNDEDFRFIQDMVISKGRLFACTFDTGLMMSDDGGESWTKSLGGGNQGFSDRASQIELAANGDLYASMGFRNTQDGIYKSTDNGNSWSYLTPSVNGFSRIEIAVAPSDSNTVYAMYENDEGSIDNIWRSYDGGSSWTAFDIPEAYNMDNFARNQAWYDMAINVHPTDADKVMVGAVDLFYSGDSGNSWTQVGQWYGGGGYPYIHADQHYILPVPGTDRVLASNDGGIYASENGFSPFPNFQMIARNLNITQFYSCAMHPEEGSNYFLGGTQDNGTHIFSNEGINATVEVTGGDGGFCFIDRDEPNIQISTFTYNTYNITKNNWQSSERVSGDNSEGSFINPCDYDDKFNKLYARGEGNVLNIIDVNSETLTRKDVPNLGFPSGFKIHPINDHELWIVTTDGKVKKISNVDGTPIVEQYLDIPGVGRNIEFHPSDPNRMIMTVSSYGVNSVYYSGNAGLSWTSCEGNLPNFPVRWAVFHPNLPQGAFIATELGVWSTEFLNGESTIWEHNSDALPLTRIDMLEIRKEDNILLAATHGRGIWSAEIDFEIVDLDGDGFFSDVDCNDFDPNVNPNAVEIVYNGIDDDCDSFTLDDDLDFDGYPLSVDCDDTNPDINPGIAEIDDNGIDENCDGLDYAVGCVTFQGGPYDLMSGGGNCANNPSEGYEVWSNESYNVNALVDGQRYIVEHCGGYNSDIFESKLTVVYYNTLSQIVGSAIATANGCYLEFVFEEKEGFPDILIIISEIEDCNLPSIEINNGLLTIDCFIELTDNDGDGFLSDVDCDDENADINPDQMELIYNGIDDDCDPTTLDDDLDQDGYNLADDCDDTNTEINPGAEDLTENGIDENCDGVDGVSAVGETEDQMVAVYPNPTHDKIYIDTEIDQLIYELYDVKGAAIKKGQMTGEIDLSNLQSGSYMLRLVTLETEQVSVQWIVKI